MIVLSCAILFILGHSCIGDMAPIIETKQGILKGIEKETRSGRPYFAFQGIPYAEPPVGSLRFKDPMPGKPWEGILDATKEHEICPQFDIFVGNFTLSGDENCLFLNVFTPKVLKNELLPVIFYIHGGGFVKGSGNPSLWGPDLILDKDVVFVTFNYRLGALGFLSTGDQVVPGNNGLKDQSLALKWVKNNIERFGGNPQKITLAGQSAGGASVYYQLLSPLSRDIPYAGIALSGITPALWSLAQKGEGRRNANRLAESLNCPTDTSHAMIACLTKIPVYNILEQSKKIMVFNYDPSIPHKPVIETQSENAFLAEHPIDIIKSSKMAQIPFMTGITTNDGSMKSASVYNNDSLVEELDSNFNDILPMFLHYDEVGYKTEDISKSIREFYLKGKDINSETKTELTDITTDALFLVPQRLTSALHAKYSKKPVYFYEFGYEGSTSYSKRFGNPEHHFGVCHCDDLLYLVYNSFIKHIPSSEDVKMTEVMTTLWYNFASTGNPTPELNSLITTKWDPVTSDDLEYYYIKDSRTFEMRKNIYKERFQFWRKLPIFDETYKLKMNYNKKLILVLQLV